MKIDVTGKQLFWIHSAMERMFDDEDNFADEKDMVEFKVAMATVYRQWATQDKNFNSNWTSPDDYEVALGIEKKNALNFITKKKRSK
jgi:hypothetical protein